MTVAFLILLALANLYIVARFIRWVFNPPEEELDQTTAMVIRK